MILMTLEIKWAHTFIKGFVSRTIITDEIWNWPRV